MKTRAMRLTTENLTLAPFGEEDREALLAMARDEGVRATYMMPDLKTPEEADAFFDRLRGYSGDAEHFLYGIFRGGLFVGMIHECGREGGVVEIGYCVTPAEWNRGVATEAFGAVIRELFRIGFETVRAGYFEDNPASRRVMEKCGLMPVPDEEEIEYRGRKRRCLYREIRRADLLRGEGADA